MKCIRIGRIEFRVGRNYCGGVAHTVHYSGRMHTWNVGPVFAGFRVFPARVQGGA